MIGSGRHVVTLALASLLALCAVDRADAGVNAFWKELGGSASGGGISKLGANVSADSARVAFGSDSLPVVVYGTAAASSDNPQAISVRRWTGTAWQDISPAPSVFGFEPRLAIATNGTRYVSWLQDDGSGLQVHLLRRLASGTSWQALGLLNSSAISAINGSVLAHALAVGTDGNPVVAFEATAQTGLLAGNIGVLQGTSQIYVTAFNGVAWQYLGGDPSAGGGASSAISLFVDGATYATHAASQPSLTVVNNRPTVAFKYSTDFGAGNGSTPTEFIPNNTEIFVVQWVANTSTWVALGPAVPQSDDAGAARGGLGGASHLPGDSDTPSIASRTGVTPAVGLTWREADPSSATATVFVRVFDGASWVPTAGVGSDAVSDPSLDNLDPQLVITPTGQAVVTWSAIDGATEQIFVKRSGPLGFEEMGPDSADGPGISDAPFLAFAPSIAAPASGGPAVAWLTNPAGDGSEQVYLRQFSSAAAFTLNVIRTGVSNGSVVVSNPIGIDCPAEACSEVFPSGQMVQLTPTGGTHVLFTGWMGCPSVTGTTCTVLMNANKTVSAAFAAANTVTLTRLGNGAATVTSIPGGISCGPGAATDCAETYRTGTSVTLNATVPVGTIFTGWGGDCAFRGTNLSCPLGPLAGDRNVTVTSTLRRYALSLRAVTKTGPPASGHIVSVNPVGLDCAVDQPTCTMLVDHGTLVQIESTAGADSRFLDHATVPPTSVCASLLNRSCPFTMTANATVTAEFRRVTALAVNKTGTGAARAGNRVTFGGDGFAGTPIDCGSDCFGEAFTNTSVVFTATVAVGSNLDPDGGSCQWQGPVTSPTRTCAFIASGVNQSVNAVFTQQKRHLHVAPVISGMQAPDTNAFAISNPPGIDCGNLHGPCDMDVDFGTRVALTPFEDANTLFSRWAGCAALNGSVCLIDMTANVTATAFFDAARTLDVVTLNNGSGAIATSLAGTPSACSASGAGCRLTRKVPTGAVGTPVVVTPKPSIGTTFRWTSSDFGCALGAGAACTAAMSANHSAAGTFTLNRHRIDVLRRQNGSVVSQNALPDTIDCQSTPGSDCTTELDFGTQVQLSASPADGFVFDHWQGVTCTGGLTNATCAFKVAGNLSIVPFFRAHTLVGVVKAGTGKGTVGAAIAAGGTLRPPVPTCGETCPALTFDAFDGRLVTLMAREAVGSRFDGFSGECVSNTSTCTYLPSGNNDSVTATFTLRRFTVTVVNNVNGSVTNSNPLVDPIDCGGGPGHTDCISTLDFGTPVVLVASPIPGFSFVSWSSGTTNGVANPCNGSTNSTCVFKLPATSFTLTPSYRRRTVVNVALVGNGQGTVISSGIRCGATVPATDCTEPIFDGRAVTLIAAATIGSRFDGFSGACVSNTSSCTFVPSGAAQTVNASFTLRPFALTVARNTNGSVVNVNPLVDPIDCGTTTTDCAATLNFNTAVQLRATPLDGFTFTSWSGALCNGVANSTNSTCTFRVPATNVTLTPNYRRRSVITVGRLGSGGGAVISTPAGINCNAVCAATFFDGRPVTLSAVPAIGSRFVGWDGCAPANATVCTVIPTVDAQMVNATFAKNPQTLTVTTKGGGSVIVNGTGGCDSGDTCQFPALFGDLVTIVAAPPSALLSFTGCTTVNGPTCTVLMNANKAVLATFAVAASLTPLGDGSGTVTTVPAPVRSCGTNCLQFTPGTSVTFTATPTAGNTFGGWGGDACAVRGTNASCTVVMNVSRDVPVTFFKPRTLTVAKSGTGAGTVTSAPAGVTCGAQCSRSYDHNTLVTLTAAAATGSVFGGFTGCDTRPTNVSCRVTMNANRTIQASFLPPTSVISVQVSGAGRVSGGGIDCDGANSSVCSQTFATGSEVVLQATPVVGNRLVTWGGACADAGGNQSCAFIAAGNTTVTATFGPAAIQVLFGGSGTGSVSVNGAVCTDTCTQPFDPSVPVFITPSATSGVFGDWGGDCEGTPRNESCRLFLPLTGSATVTVSFLSDPVSVDVLGDSNVTIVSTYPDGAGHARPFTARRTCAELCQIHVEPGTVITVASIPQPGKIFQNFVFDCVGGDNASPCIQRVSAISTVNQSALYILFDGDAQAGVSVIPSSGGGPFDCDRLPIPCIQLYSPNETVTIQPRLGGAGDIHLGYLPDCLGVTNCSVDLRPDKAVMALFARNTPKRVTVDAAGNVAAGVTYQLTDITGATVVGDGSCEGDCVIDGLDPGTRIQLSPRVDPSTGAFFGWSGDCSGFTANESCELVASRNLSVTAVFAALPVPAGDFPTLTLTTDTGSGTGCVSADGPTGSSGCRASGTAVFAHGAQVDIATIADRDSALAGLTGDCTFVDPDTIVMDHSCQLIATFTRVK